LNRIFPDPENAKNAVDLFKEFHKRLPPKKREILHLLSSYSRFLGRAVIKEPEILDLLLKSDYLGIQKPFDKIVQEATEVAARSGSAEDFMSQLRRYKYREFSRIIYRDIMDLGNFPEIMEELSDLAGGILEAAVRFFKRELQIENLGKFVVMGMGKLGGRELNLSSDIDLIYLYEGSGDPDPFFKLAEKVTKSISSLTQDGFIYRVDLGLRPGGGKSTIAVSLEGALEHYFYWGDTWERAALIKARPVAGDISLGENFNKEIAAFVYKRFLDYASIEDLKDMKTKLDRLHKKQDVKLGKGGIREIEFFVQALQLVNGGAIDDVREKNTLQALKKLFRNRLIEKDIFLSLTSSYLFLRRVEHAIQLADEIQTHKIPEDPSDLQKLSRRLGFIDSGEFEKEYEKKTSQVSKSYDQLFYEPSRRIEREGKEFWELADFLTDGNAVQDEAIDNLKGLGFKRPETAIELIDVLLDTKKGGLTQRGRSFVRKIIPAFLSKIISSPDPDAALINLERFISGIRFRTSLYAMLAENPQMLELLSRLFATSRYLSSFLIRHPEYLDLLTLKDVRKEFGSKEEMIEELKRVMSEEEEFEGKLDALRRFKHVETLKLCLRDLHREVESFYVGNYLSKLAESMMEAGLSLARETIGRKPSGKDNSSDIVVLGMGKLGGREMSYNSDIDLIFIYEGDDHEFFSRLGQKMISILSTPTGEGFAYKIDTGLRPSGNSGALVSSFESFKKYHEDSAKLWERQALIRARPTAGNKALGKRVMKKVEYFVYGKTLKEDFYKEIDHLRNRMEKELAKESKTMLNLKTGKGGIVDIEFLVQMLQLRFGSDHHTVRRQNTLDALHGLRELGLIDETVFSVLSEGLTFLKKLENLLRLLHDESTNELYDSDFHKLALELDMKGRGESLKEIYLSKTNEIRRIYNEHFS